MSRVGTSIHHAVVAKENITSLQPPLFILRAQTYCGVQ